MVNRKATKTEGNGKMGGDEVTVVQVAPSAAFWILGEASGSARPRW